MIDQTFLNELASKAPTPGGGGASAYVGAISSGLATMVGCLTVGKKKYADYEPQIIASMERLEGLRARLVQLIDDDAAAFGPLAACYGMPSGTPEEAAAKDAAMQAALVDACEVPLQIMSVCVDVLEECTMLAYHGSRLALSDVGAAVALGEAAVRAASLNVVINVKSMTDPAQAASCNERMEQLLARAKELCDELYPYVVKEIS